MDFKSTTQAFLVAAALAAATPSTWAESTNSITFESWTNDTAAQYNGRIPRDIYLDETGRRWNADTEVSRMTGKVDSSTSGVPKSGSGVQPGNMGPSNSKAQ